jgi:hypothetical protein
MSMSDTTHDAMGTGAARLRPARAIVRVMENFMIVD